MNELILTIGTIGGIAYLTELAIRLITENIRNVKEMRK